MSGHRADRYCTFSVDGLAFGAPVQHVQEVMRAQELTRVPLAAPAVRGLINLRGQIVPAVDLRRQLGLPDRHPEQLPMHMVVRTNGEPVSLLVDEIGDVVHVDPDSYEPRPATVRGRAEHLVDSMYKLPDRLLLVLDVERAVDVDWAERKSA